jgi:hypothetical protein
MWMERHDPIGWIGELRSVDPLAKGQGIKGYTPVRAAESCPATTLRLRG